MLVSGGRVCLDLGYDVLECTMKRAGLVGLLLAACSSENDLLSQVDAAPGDAAPDEETTLPADTALPEEETDTGDAGDSIKNQPPGAPSVVIHPESPGANHDLECVISEAAVDPDAAVVLAEFCLQRAGKLQQFLQRRGSAASMID